MRKKKAIKVFAPAKLNLILRVGNRRDDGYHDLVSLVQIINLFDTLTIKRIASGVEIEKSGPHFPGGRNNLCYAAASRFLKGFGLQDGVRISAVKHIPSGAGLGGGSSNAASVLRGMARLFSVRAAKKRLLAIAETLGSDVPLFLAGVTSIIEGRGEKVTPVSMSFSAYYVVACPPLHSSTPVVYAKYKPVGKLKTKIALPRDSRELARLAANDLERAAFAAYPALREAGITLNEKTGRKFTLAGSGAAFFAVAKNEPDSCTLAELVKANFAEWFVSALRTYRTGRP